MKHFYLSIVGRSSIGVDESRCNNRLLHDAGLLATTAPAQSKPDESVSFHITGHVLTSAGKPVEDANVHLKGLGFDQPFQEDLSSNSEGAFSFSIHLLGRYRISPGSGFKGNSKIIDVTIPMDGDSGNFTFERCPAPVEATTQSYKAEPDLVGDLTLNQIVIDAPPPTNRDPPTLTPPQPSSESLKADADAEDPQCWFGLASLANRADWQHLSNVNLTNWVSVEAFVGGRVNAIHVIHLSSSSRLTPDEIREQVRRVWLGSFRDAATSIGWSEGNPWNIEARVEFDDGKQASIWTDSSGHVQFQDREGKYWFVRLYPAAQ